MEINKEQLDLLTKQLKFLSAKQKDFQTEINALHLKIEQLKTVNLTSDIPKNVTEIKPQPNLVETKKTHVSHYIPEPVNNSKAKIQQELELKKDNSSTKGLEEFIGGNVISKVGIIITIIGIGIGIKYSIDNNLISPLVRVLIGYLFGLGFVGIGLKLKTKYLNYSAILVSGGITTLYFITFFAYSLYEIMPQLAAFILMVVFTVFTVLIALNYDREIIAHFGLVGAYAVPFLLSDGSGRVQILFSYIAIINIGILYVSFFRKWSRLITSAFVLTWFIFLYWFTVQLRIDQHYAVALTFASIFFVTFYGIILVEKVLKREAIKLPDLYLLTLNSFIFFGVGIFCFERVDNLSDLKGLFALTNAVLHAAVAMWIVKQKLQSLTIYYLILGVALTIFTIAIPIQFNGFWITLLWSAEAAVLFSIGRLRKINFIEQFAYPLLIVATFSLFDDWQDVYHNYYKAENSVNKIAPFFNLGFLSSTFFLVAFGVMNFIHYKTPLAENAKSKLNRIVDYALPSILVFIGYLAFREDITNYFRQLWIDSTIPYIEGQYPNKHRDGSLLEIRNIWVINFSLFYWAFLSLFNRLKFKNSTFAIVQNSVSLLFILLFLTQGLYDLSELRAARLFSGNNSFQTSSIYLGLRYFCYPFIIFSFFEIYKTNKKGLFHKDYRNPFELVVAVTTIWILSSELIGWLNIAGFENSYKLGLSILWGSCCLILILWGIIKSQQHLRVAAIGFFGLTLLKLFVYDISHLETIQKTVVFVSLGILLLIISFLYNKFQKKLFEE